MTPDVSSTEPVRRRSFLVGGAVAAAAAVTGASAIGSRPAHAADLPGTGLTAAVHEYRDQWTSATGLAELLRRAGMNVVDLDLTRAADDQPTPVDLIAFGKFTNNAQPYLDYTSQRADSIRAFVAAGGTVLDFAQSDQYGSETVYLPPPMRAQRTDRDSNSVYAVVADHPLFAGLPTSGGQLFTGRQSPFPVSYESLGAWEDVRILAAIEADGAPPCVAEGAHGDGRFVITSLTVDACFDAANQPLVSAAAIAESETFFANVAAYVGTVRAGTAPEVTPTPQPSTGPLIGHVDHNSARIWARPGLDPEQFPDWTCTVQRGNQTKQVLASIAVDRDKTLLFDVDGLKPDAEHTVTIAPATPADGFAPLTGSFKTAPAPGTPGLTVMGLGSCALTEPNSLWDRVRLEGCESFVLLGDTPYIDSTNLTVVRQKHREFLQQPELAALSSSMPVWGTWDDHDFGLNSGHGDLVGKENSRQGFAEYRANATFGHGADGALLTEPAADGEGIYTSFRRGPIEVFLLDPRWFSRTEPSWADPSQPTCIGAVQWEWFRTALSQSTAPFKAICSGQIWDDKQNSETDDWGTFVYEREAIFDFIESEQIPGCFLVGGDIHVSRALNYGPRVGYDLWQFIVSPIHASTIPSLNVPNPALVHSAVEPHVFLKLVADSRKSGPSLTATWINRAGQRIFEVSLTAAQLGTDPASIRTTACPAFTSRAGHAVFFRPAVGPLV